MSRSGEFCPRCGETIERDVSLDAEGPDAALCDACYLDEYDLVEAPDRVEVNVCARCGAVHRGNRWVDVGAEDYTDIAVEEVTEALSVHVAADSISWQVAPEQVDETTIRMHCQFSGVLRGTPVAEEVTVPVKIGRQTCTRCGQIAGGSYAATVQVRARERTPTEDETDRAVDIAEAYIDDREGKGDRNAFISEINEVNDGVDVKVSTSQIGRAIADRIVRELGGTVDEARRLVSEDDDGQRLYRMAYAARLPAYRPGEVIAPDDDGPVLVTSVQGNLKGTRLTTGERYEASFEDGQAPDADRLGWREDAQETTLVAIEDERAVQVLDPETYEAKTIARPDYMDPDADEVPVLKSPAGVFVLPDNE
ncbi:60S ribosomal export protein NMD3 [Salinibaculum rarum]|uniref:60S ribosomal export protein NMD3 n=1 Tax=Salinibaculum rarum TaxID=3058903 RepID=UPI00265E4436|nr:60S ribosomal export protein NMD3 [Salinibaculum sp. KK48]